MIRLRNLDSISREVGRKPFQNIVFLVIRDGNVDRLSPVIESHRLDAWEIILEGEKSFGLIIISAHAPRNVDWLLIAFFNQKVLDVEVREDHGSGQRAALSHSFS